MYVHNSEEVREPSLISGYVFWSIRYAAHPLDSLLSVLDRPIRSMGCRVTRTSVEVYALAYLLDNLHICLHGRGARISSDI